MKTNQIKAELLNAEINLDKNVKKLKEMKFKIKSLDDILFEKKQDLGKLKAAVELVFNVKEHISELKKCENELNLVKNSVDNFLTRVRENNMNSEANGALMRASAIAAWAAPATD